VPLGKQGKLERDDDQDIARDENHPLAQAQVVVIAWLVREADGLVKDSTDTTVPPAHAWADVRRYTTTRHTRMPPSWMLV